MSSMKYSQSVRKDKKNKILHGQNEQIDYAACSYTVN
jgi:hypothetical protein